MPPQTSGTTPPTEAKEGTPLLSMKDAPARLSLSLGSNEHDDDNNGAIDYHSAKSELKPKWKDNVKKLPAVAGAVLVVIVVVAAAFSCSLVAAAVTRRRKQSAAGVSASASASASAGAGAGASASPEPEPKEAKPIGPYRLVERQEGRSFFDHYDFYSGPDSLGSAGYNTYVGKDEALSSGLAAVLVENATRTDAQQEQEEAFAYMRSRPTADGPRDSIRLEGRSRFNHGLFVLDVRHMPTGAGAWPAFWLTDESAWPNNGEIDIVEGVNRLTSAKTALHTSDRCSMYAHVPAWFMTGHWDYATDIPNTFTGQPDFRTWKEADDCWVMAAHQWANQGCVVVDARDDTLGEPVNRAGGGVYALEWDPENRRIRSWAFVPSSSSSSEQNGSGNDENGDDFLPPNLRDAIRTAHLADDNDGSSTTSSSPVLPDTSTWGLPYAYFAIGETTGCSANHFYNMRLVFDLAFCGSVAGNRFFADCPKEAQEYNVENNPILSCNAYVKSEPQELEDEAFWKIKGVYVYQRELE